MANIETLPLILGGHSFFSQLGNDPVPDDDTQAELVNACLDRGIRWFDTTHQPERTALGKALARLGRRNEATIIVWNFLQALEPGDPLDRPAFFEEHLVERMFEQLQTGHIECLVLHEIDRATEEDRKRLEEVALVWQKKGYVDRLGCWAPGENAVEKYGPSNLYRFMVKPLNIASKDAAPAFAACKRLGWENYACSPFVRGWELDKMVEKALRLEPGSPAAMKAKLAGLLLRFSLYHPHVDKLITAIRKLEWIDANIMSCQRGPLTATELDWLRRVEDHNPPANPTTPAA